MATEHRVAVIAELRQFREQMATMPGVGEKEARDMVRGIARQLKLAEDAARKAAKGVESSFKEGFDKTTMFAKELASQFVPALHPIADVVESVGGAFLDLTEVAGPVGASVAGVAVAFAAATAATAGVVYGMKQIADSALEAEGRLRDAGHAAQIDPAASASLAMYESATERVSTAVDALTVDVGADLAPALSKMADVTLVVIDRFRDWWPTLVDISTELQKVSPLVWLFNAAVDTSAESASAAAAEYGGVKNMFLGLKEPTKAEREEFERLEKAFADYQARLKDQAARQAAAEWKELLTPPTTRWDLEGIMQADEITKWATDTVEWNDAWREIEYTLKGLNAQVGDLEPGLDRSLGHLEDAADEGVDSAVKLAEGWEAAGQQALNAINAIAGQILDVWTSAYAEDLAAATETAEEKAALNRDLADELIELQQELQHTGDVTRREEILGEIATNKKRQALANDAAQDAKKAALEAWEDNRSAQAAAVGVNAAAAFGMTLAVSPIPFPANLAAAGAVSAAVLAQLIPIMSAQPPEFPTGGMVSDRMSPDHVAIGARPDEAVLTGRGVRTAGGRAGIEALNRGQSGPSTVNLIVDGRAVASAVIGQLGDALLQPTPGSWAAGRRPLYGR